MQRPQQWASHFQEHLWADPSFVLQAVQLQASAFQAASEGCRADPTIAWAAVERHGAVAERGRFDAKMAFGCLW